MLLHHPVLALHHAWDGRKKPQKLTKKNLSWRQSWRVCPQILNTERKGDWESRSNAPPEE
jgi:hypothetical protein